MTQAELTILKRMALILASMASDADTHGQAIAVATDIAMIRPHGIEICPCCGQETDKRLTNETGIKSTKNSSARIELTDEQISRIASGMFVLQVVPR